LFCLFYYKTRHFLDIDALIVPEVKIFYRFSGDRYFLGEIYQAGCIGPDVSGLIHRALFIGQDLNADHPARGIPEGQAEGLPGKGTEVVEELAQVGGAAAAFDIEAFA
jgi:hypothetical protein